MQPQSFHSMRKWLVSGVLAVVVLSMSLYVGNELLALFIALLALIVGAIVWVVGKMRQRNLGAVALTVVGIGVFQLLSVPINDQVSEWESQERWLSHPPDAALDSALAIRPVVNAAGSYHVSTCFVRCSADDDSNVILIYDIMLLTDTSNPSWFPLNNPFPNGCLHFWDESGPNGSPRKLDDVSYIYWIRRTDGTVAWRGLRSISPTKWGYIIELSDPQFVAVTSDEFFGFKTVWADWPFNQVRNIDWYYAGRRTGPPNAAECGMGEMPS